MILYTSDGGKYEGMSEDVVTALRAQIGKSTTFVTKTEYDTYMAYLATLEH